MPFLEPCPTAPLIELPTPVSPARCVPAASVLRCLRTALLVVFCGESFAEAPAQVPHTGPDQIHAAWVSDPATSLHVIWRTQSATPSILEYRPLGTETWHRKEGGPRESSTAGFLFEAGLTGLTPGTVYEYRVRGSDGVLSRICRARTAPLPGSAPIEFLFLADTGLVGRPDGLDEATGRVIAAMASYDPTVVLLGGDYAYANSDLRGGSMPSAVDAWFAQMTPLAERAVMMPTYGNHEIKLLEDYLFWAERFATPEGHDNRRFYSFDVGDVHFVSILAWADNLRQASGTEHGWIGASAVKWIERDMEAARKRGMRWIIPFMHVPPFSDGMNHPSNVDVRAQLGPVFERFDVKIVLTAHDQSYERTFPLRDVPATNTPTSRQLDEYTSADGVTYLKVGPGGKLSNKNKGFSAWRTNPPPAHTAFRNNTAHHFARIHADAKRLEVEIHAIQADRADSFVQDRFVYVLDELN